MSINFEKEKQNFNSSNLKQTFKGNTKHVADFLTQVTKFANLD